MRLVRAPPSLAAGGGLSDPCRTQLRVGIVLSGGQAPGGHNVIGGLLDSLMHRHPGSRLFGFLDGPRGILERNYKEITVETMVREEQRRGKRERRTAQALASPGLGVRERAHQSSPEGAPPAFLNGRKTRARRAPGARARAPPRSRFFVSLSDLPPHRLLAFHSSPSATRAASTSSAPGATRSRSPLI